LLRRLEIEDLAALSHEVRSEDLTKSFHARQKAPDEALWFTVLKAHYGIVVWQWSLTVLEAFLSYGPQICMYKLLKILEHRQDGEFAVREAWAWVIGLGVLKLIHGCLESW
jgi:hypothetical protein